jgi:hypothetical protein
MRINMKVDKSVYVSDFNSYVISYISSNIFKNLFYSIKAYLQFFFSIVLNFFPEPVEEECVSVDKRRLGICMNTYECRLQGGIFHGPCALGFGVCCICKYFNVNIILCYCDM